MAGKSQATTKEKARYVGTTYPNWIRNGMLCTIVARQGAGVFIVFEGDDGQYMVHANDVAALQ